MLMPRRDLTLQAGGATIDFTPYAMARMSNSFFEASNAYSAREPVFNYFMRCASLELGFKAAILSQDNTQTMKDFLAKRGAHRDGVGHDLMKAHAQFSARFPDILTTDELNALAGINPFFKTKGLEYVTLDVVVALMNGLSSFPNLETVKSASQKMSQFLSEKKFFIEA